VHVERVEAQSGAQRRKPWRRGHEPQHHPVDDVSILPRCAHMQKDARMLWLVRVQFQDVIRREK
jgi:hypothetical protein